MKNFSFNEYFQSILKLILFDSDLIKKLNIAKKKIFQCKKNNKKVIIVGNGGSASIANHFALDLTKLTGIRSISFSDSAMLTAFGNDYGYENWVKKSLDFYADKGDILILISSSGISKNILNATKSKKINYVITFSGFSNKNKLRKLGDLNFYVKSNVYNIVENIHQIWILSLADSLKLKKIEN
jgi:D-sedoheptulose 7-phosphate isomerase